MLSNYQHMTGKKVQSWNDAYRLRPPDYIIIIIIIVISNFYCVLQEDCTHTTTRKNGKIISF